MGSPFRETSNSPLLRGYRRNASTLVRVGRDRCQKGPLCGIDPRDLALRFS